MEVIFSAPQKLGNKSYKKGPQSVPDSLAYNRAFKALVKTGAITIKPRDAAAQKIQMSRDAKAFQKAKAARIAARALKASKSAQAASGASPTQSSAAGADQPLQTPAQPILAGATTEASVPVAPATASSSGEHH